MNKKWLMPKEEYEKCVDELLVSFIKRITCTFCEDKSYCGTNDGREPCINPDKNVQELYLILRKLNYAKSPEGQPVEKCEQECIENYHKATQGGEAEAELLTEIAKLCRQQDVMTMQDCGGTLFEQWGEMAEESRVFYYSSADQILAHCEYLIRVSVYKEIEAYRVPKEVYPFTEPIIISKEQFASLKSGKGVK